MADGHLGMETWCLQGWWLPPAQQRLLDRGAAAPLQPGSFFWGGSPGFVQPGRHLVPPGVHGHGTMQMHWGASLAAPQPLPPGSLAHQSPDIFCSRCT